MKLMLTAFSCILAFFVDAQTKELPSAVNRWKDIKVRDARTGQRRQILNGSTLDLASLSIHSSTLKPGVANHPPVVYSDVEELVIIKEGRLSVTINDSTKELGPGGLVLVVAGSKQTFTNQSKNPCTYYVLAYKSKNPVNIQRGKMAGSTFIKDWTELEVRKTDKGESRPIFDRASSMFERFDVHATTLNPGFASHAAHTHRVEEIILMIRGNGEMQIGNTFNKATAGDVILLNSKVPHAIKNTGTVPCSYFAIQWHNLKND
ncbi:MAG: cupin domain-containing protein [Chitinophagaceae bacterium]